MATMVVRHTVAEYPAWRKVYDGVEELRSKHRCSGDRVLRAEDDPAALLVLHEFPTLADARGFVADPGLRDAMGRAGVTGQPRIELYDDVS